MAGRGLAWIARNGPKANVKGCVLSAFNKGDKLVTSHPLDTNRDEYLKVNREVVIPTCQELTADVPEYQKRIHDVMTNNHPLFDPCWNFGVELMYRMVAPERDHTPENLMKMRIVRSCTDLIFDLGGLLDDVTDEALQRGRKDCWYRVCSGGMYSAIYDAVILGFLPYHILKKFFRKDKCYSLMMEEVTKGAMSLMIGQNMDTLDQRKEPNLDVYNKTLFYKNGCTYVPMATLGAAFAGITDDKTIQQIANVFVIIGRIAQQWDDFNEYYASLEANGKRSEDFKNGANSWSSATAFETFNPEQKKRFLELYGTPDPANEEAVKKLYDDIDLPRIYLANLFKEYSTMRPLIAALPSHRIQAACQSYAEWLLGDITDPEFVRELGLTPV